MSSGANPAPVPGCDARHERAEHDRLGEGLARRLHPQLLAAPAGADRGALALPEIAESHPGTIPYSESVGFIADLREESCIDYVLRVKAHDVVVGGEVQGPTMSSQTLARHSAMLVDRDRHDDVRAVDVRE